MNKEIYSVWENQYFSKKNTNQSKISNQKMLREISNDDVTPKKHNFELQNELHSRIRNDEDYDDWEYGTEPLYEFQKHE